MSARQRQRRTAARPGSFRPPARLLDLGQRARRGQTLIAVEETVAELLHGEDRHRVGGGVGKADALLRVTHLIGEWPAARHDDQRQLERCQGGDPVAQLRLVRPCCRRA